MSELYLPLDYEQLPEYWQLRSALKDHLASAFVQLRRDTPAPDSQGGEGEKRAAHFPRLIDQAATFMLLRLFVTLGYLARSTNRPGWLTSRGAEQYASSLEPLYGAVEKDGPGTEPRPGGLPADLLVKCGLLTAEPEPNPGWFCPLFARLNPHLAGNFKRGCDKGNTNSRISAALKRVTEEAAHQCMMFPPEKFKKRDQSEMTATESQRSMVLIQMVDRCLGLRQRAKGEFTDGLMASACAVVEQHDSDALRNFYFWLGNNRQHPSLPKTTEELLLQFETYFPMAV